MFVLRSLRSWVFRTPETIEDRLCVLHEQISKLENLKASDISTEKKLIFFVALYSFLLYGCTFVLSYLFYWPTTRFAKFMMISSLFLFPVIIYAFQKALKMYFLRRVDYKDRKLRELLKEKKALVDQVMETETYNRARQILKKYEPSKLSGLESQQKIIHARTAESTKSNGNLRNRKNVTDSEAKSDAALKLPRPILPQNRSFGERMIDLLVGDGPSNRYALICKTCSSHNGMALAEEFEFIAFKCCYCGQLNPERRKRSIAPSLVQENNTSPEETTKEAAKKDN